MKSKIKAGHKLSALLVLALSIGNSAAYCNDSTTDTPSSDSSSTNSDTTTATSIQPTQTQLLKGSVQTIQLDLEKLRDVGLDFKHVLKAASSLYDEVMIQPMQIITEPEIIGSGVVINIPVAEEPIGPPQPPRKERVDLAMNNMEPYVAMLKKNVDQFVADEEHLNLPDTVIDGLKPEFDDWSNSVSTIATQEAQLEQLTQGPSYDNEAIAALATSIQQEIKKLDKTRLNIYKTVRKEGERLDHEAKRSK